MRLSPIIESCDMSEQRTITNILVVGIGGQGVMTATEILAEAAIALGHDVKKTEVAGMAQRGGVVSSHLRFGPKVLSPQIMAGTADLLLGFEAAEALRWCHYLRPGGLALMNTAQLVPPVVDIGLYDYPDDPMARDPRRAAIEVRAFDAMAIALELGDIRLGNTVMLGAHRRPPAVPGRGAARLPSSSASGSASRSWSNSTARPSRPAARPLQSAQQQEEAAA